MTRTKSIREDHEIVLSTKYSVLGTLRLLVAALALVLVVASVAVPASLAADRPNILWLIAEDFGPHLGCYGEKQVATPNLDCSRGRRRAVCELLHHRPGLLAEPLRRS